MYRDIRPNACALLIANCDEFIYYDDLVAKPVPAKRKTKKSKAGSRKTAKNENTKTDPVQEAMDLVLNTTEALYSERGDRSKLWGSMIKQTLKRRRPQFNETYYGFSSFNDLLEEAQARDLIELEMDERSGGYIVRSIRRKNR